MRFASTTLAFGFVAVSVLSAQVHDDMADEGTVMYKGVEVYTEGGLWQEIDGRLAQTDPTALMAGALASVGVQGVGEYTFDVSTIGGTEDGTYAFGALVSGFAMGLVRDVSLGGSGLYARVYNQERQIHEYAGTTYSFELSKSLATHLDQMFRTGTPLTIRIRIDSTNGSVSIKDPLDAKTWWRFTLGQPLATDAKYPIGVGTWSASAVFDNFQVREIEYFPSATNDRLPLPATLLALDSDGRQQVQSIRDSLIAIADNVDRISASENTDTERLNGLESSLMELTELASDLPSIFAGAIDSDSQSRSRLLRAGRRLNGILGVIATGDYYRSPINTPVAGAI